MKMPALHKPALAETRLKLLIWLAIFLMVLADMVGMYLRGIHLNIGSLVFYDLLFVVVVMGISLLLRYKWPDETAYKGCEALTQFMAFLLPGGILSYITVLPLPYCDAALMHMDKALGFNWLGYLAWVNRYPLISLVLFFAYFSGMPQMITAIVVLAVVRQFDRMYGFILAIVLGAIIAIGIASFLPATGTYTYLHLNNADYPNVSMWAGHSKIDDFNQLRGGQMHALSPEEFKGMVTFPSYHAAVAVILIWAFWSVRGFRWLFLAINILMLAATPINGCHYLVDVIAGAFIAIAVIFIVKLIIKSVTPGNNSFSFPATGASSWPFQQN